MINLIRPDHAASAMDRMFHQVFGSTTKDRLQIAVSEHEDGWTIRAETPGVRREDLSIELHRRALTLRGSRKDGDQEAAFERTVRLGEDIDDEGIVAHYENGVLAITLPKTAAVGPRTIEID